MKNAPDELPAKKEDCPGRIEERVGLISRSLASKSEKLEL